MTLTSYSEAPGETLAPGTLFRFATAGSVDDGKSTLVGRLLHDSKAILSDHLAAVEHTSAQRGFGGDAGGLDLALLTDGLRAEREQGITIDVAYRYFATAARSFILADCPGHVQYTRNMVTGAATADAVIVLVDVRHGVVEQTRRHLAVLALLRIPHVIVALNKIDLVDSVSTVVEQVADEVRRTALAIGIENVHVVPVSALAGDNVSTRSSRTPWYHGPTLLELLESLPAVATSEETLTSDLRLPVQLALRPQGALAPGLDGEKFRDYRAAAGRIVSGTVSVGDTVSIHPGTVSSVVTRIDVAGRNVSTAHAPQSVAISLADNTDLANGALIASVNTLPEPRSRISTTVFWLSEQPGKTGDRLLAKWGSATVQARLGVIEGKRDLDTLDMVPADRFDTNDIGAVDIDLATPLPVDRFATHRGTGAFILIHPQTGATLAAGTIS